MSQNQESLFWCVQSGPLSGGCGNKIAMEVLDPLKQVPGSSMQSNNLYHCAWPPAFQISALVASMSVQGSGLLGPLTHLFFSFGLQPAHLLLPPLGSHGVEVSKKMVLRPVTCLSINSTHGRGQN